MFPVPASWCFVVLFVVLWQQFDSPLPLFVALYPLTCSALQTDISGVPELHDRRPAGASPAPHTEAPRGATAPTLRDLQATLRVLIEDTETDLQPGSETVPGGSKILRPRSAAARAVSGVRCGAEGTVSGGHSPSVQLQLRTSR